MAIKLIVKVFFSEPSILYRLASDSGGASRACRRLANLKGEKSDNTFKTEDTNRSTDNWNPHRPIILQITPRRDFYTDPELCDLLRSLAVEDDPANTDAPSFRGKIIATQQFLGSKDTPESVYPGSMPTTSASSLFRHKDDNHKCLIYTHGGCSLNGRYNARAGCSFVFGPDKKKGLISFPLKRKGPSGEPHKLTNNRAALRAVIGALRYRKWNQDKINAMVIATDLDYVVEGATNWIRNWIDNGWQVKGGDDVKNQDLWKCLLKEFEHWANHGVKVEFLLVTKDMESEMLVRAKNAASAAQQDRVPESFQDIRDTF
ncbi:hypothetical protein KEM56_006035 [Ascosphaera pollenicola]|nr:hypothetical protein KEM56_006035 [Ascosphaera pollenicola]